MEDNVEVKPLENFPNKRKEQPVIRKVGREHEQFVVRLPAKLVKLMNFFQGEIYVEFTEPNPLRGEIKIRFSSNRLKQGNSQGNSENQPSQVKANRRNESRQ